MDEIWKDVPYYEGIYQASTRGRIRSLDRVSQRDNYYLHDINLAGRVFKPTVHESGYVRTPLRKNGVTKFFYVHNIIAATFLGVRTPNTDVDHIDHNRQNNNISNLRYLSIKENRGIPGNKHAENFHKLKLLKNG